MDHTHSTVLLFEYGDNLCNYAVSFVFLPHRAARIECSPRRWRHAAPIPRGCHAAPIPRGCHAAPIPRGCRVRQACPRCCNRPAIPGCRNLPAFPIGGGNRQVCPGCRNRQACRPHRSSRPGSRPGSRLRLGRNQGRKRCSAASQVVVVRVAGGRCSLCLFLPSPA